MESGREGSYTTSRSTFEHVRAYAESRHQHVSVMPRPKTEHPSSFPIFINTLARPLRRRFIHQLFHTNRNNSSPSSHHSHPPLPLNQTTPTNHTQNDWRQIRWKGLWLQVLCAIVSFASLLPQSLSALFCVWSHLISSFSTRFSSFDASFHTSKTFTDIFIAALPKLVSHSQSVVSTVC